MKAKQILRALGCAAIVSLVAVAHAAGNNPKELTITGVEPSFATHTLAISGLNFSAVDLFSGTVTLFVPGQGDVTLPVVSFVAANQEIVASFPPALATMPGSYLLTVSNRKSSDTFSVSFGVAGPVGPQGLMGPVGPIGAMGPTGPKGDTGSPLSFWVCRCTVP